MPLSFDTNLNTARVFSHLDYHSPHSNDSLVKTHTLDILCKKHQHTTSNERSSDPNQN